MNIAVFEDDHLLIQARQETSERKSNAVLLSFTGVGHAMGALNVQQPEFFGAGRNFDNILFVTDKTRSWGNRIDFDRLRRKIEPFAETRHLDAIGNSMGGFNAILASSFLPLRHVFAFAPQFSVKPEIVPWENRWRQYVPFIEAYHYESLAGHFNNASHYYIFSGGIGNDLRHAEMFPVAPNIHHAVFPTVCHDVSVQIKRAGQLNLAIEQCLSGRQELDLELPFFRLSPAA